MRKLRRIALFLPFLLSSCSAVARPAFDSDLYSAYKDTEIVSLRDGYLVFYPDRPRGTAYECFSQRGGRLLTPAELPAVGAEVLRKIEPGEKLLAKEVVYFDKLPGPWVQTVLEKDQAECVIPAVSCLKLHLLLTATEAAEWEKIPEETRRRLLAREIQVGMSRAQILIAWGEPYKQIESKSPGATTEIWVYQRGEKRLVYLNFEGDTLASWTE